MPYSSNAALPDRVKMLPEEAQSMFRAVVNNALKEYNGDESKAFATAWAALKRAGWEKVGDNWQKVSKSDFSAPVEIRKVDADRNIVFGWANIAVRKDGQQVVDTQGDMIDAAELEEAGYNFVLNFRSTGEMHKGDSKGELIESFVVTPEKLQKMGLPADSLPIGWWVGFHISDDAVFAKVKEGKYSAFSIQGKAVREEVK